MRRHRPYSYAFQRLSRSLALRFLVILGLIWDSLHTISLYQSQQAALRAAPSPRNTKRVYIAAQHWNTAHILESHWNKALSALVQELGIENVFVSIYESGSYDYTKDALRELDRTLDELHVQKNIILSEISHADEIAQQPTGHGWIKAPSGETELRRIPFLASVRNRVFEPLETLVAQGERFDTILFLNDVVFTTEDVLRLLHTNGGDYAAACSLDFSKPPAFYDTFALRDSSGHEAMMSTWPYFRSRLSRNAMEKGLPVPVTSCWNGMGIQFCIPLYFQMLMIESGHADCSLRVESSTPLPWSYRLSRSITPRGLRVLPYPRRQSFVRVQGHICEPKCESWIQRIRL
jgi:hypothetical protein